MKNKLFIPLALTTLRLGLGPVALYAACAGWPRLWFLPLMLAALFSDIYDGVLARRFGVSTPAVRRYDSITDIIFYLFILVSLGVLVPALLVKNWPWIALALGAEAGCLSYALIKFRRPAAAHSYLAKFFGLALFAGLTASLCQAGAAWILPALSLLCLLVNAEIILMMLISKQPPVDVKSLFLLFKARKFSLPKCTRKLSGSR